ncbi:hypothetical protein GCK32_016752, partial [Trichostrongylus colubriformis]
KGKYYSCYLIDRSELKETDQWEFKRDETSGLKACDIGSLTVSISLTEEHLIGELGQGVEVRDELASINCLPLAAATAGYGKRLLNGLAAFCNRTPSARRENDLLSNDPGLQYTTTEFALKVYALESASYYLAGLLDERLPVVLDIENALIHVSTGGQLILIKLCGHFVINIASCELTLAYPQSRKEHKLHMFDRKALHGN